MKTRTWTRKFKMMRSSLNSLFSICLLFGMHVLNAKTDTYINSLSGTAIVTNAIYEVQDDHWNGSGLDAYIQHTFSVKNVILLEISDHDNLFKNAIINDSVSVLIEKTSLNGTITTETVKLKVDYNPNPASVYNARCTYTFSNAYKVKVTISAAPASNTFLKLTTFIIIDRIYNFDITKIFNLQQINPDLIAGSDPTTNTITIQWKSVPGADEYDVEYNYYALNSTELVFNATTYTDFDWIYNKNASRITTSASFAKFQIVYPDGYLFYRVRAVHYNKDGLRETTNWSSNTLNPAVNLTTYPSKILLTPLALEANKNWQMSRVFAEEGKNITSIKYFDGSLRERQSITELKYENKSLLSSTLYDHFGRPVINVIPYPDSFNHIRYRPNILRKNNISQLTKNNYDGIRCIDQAHVIQLDTTIGSAKYYSANNTFTNLPHYDHIPKANGFNYSQTVYMQDATDRPLKKTIPGDQFRLLNGKETTFFYGKPTTNEIDRLFGNEAGFDTYYQKNMTRDPNGQLSVTYLNSSGKTVATALAGYTPPALDSLPNNTVEVIMTDSIGRDALVDDTLKSSQSLLLPITSDVKLYYNINPVAYMNSCQANTCYDCLYNINITIKDDCGATLLSFNKANYSLGSGFNTDCSVGSPNPPIFDSVTVTALPAGDYIITKALTIPEDTLNVFAERFLKNNTCLMDSTVLKNSLISSLSGNCGIDCSTCISSLGTQSSFITAYIGKIQGWGGTPNAGDTSLAIQVYTDALADCKELCEPPNDCSILRDLIETDMTPGGQYATYEYDAASDKYICNDVTSIFYGTNPKWKTIIYKDEFGFPDSIEFDDYKVAVNEVSMDEFIDNTKDEWIQQLMPLHPEYCYLKWCDSLRAYLTLDSLMRRYDDYTSAKAFGWLDSIEKIDPFFAIGAPGALYKDSITIKLKKYAVGSCDTLSIQDILKASVFCNGGWPCTDTSACIQDKNMYWAIFRDVYFGIKLTYMCKLIELYGDLCWAASGGPVNPKCIGINTSNCSPNTYASKERRWTCPSPPPINNLDIYVESTRDSIAKIQKDSMANSCDSYVESWMNSLSQCPCLSNAVMKDSIKARFVRLCKKSVDVNHPLGATTIPGNTGDTSFAQILKSVCGVTYTICEKQCNTAFIQFPGSYTKSIYLGPKNLITLKRDTCICNNLERLAGCYNSLMGADTAVTTFLSFLQLMGDYHLTQAELDTLTAHCNSQCNSLPANLAIPPYLDCDKCRTGTEVAFQDSVYFATCLTNTVKSTYEAHMNFNLGLNLDSVDFKAYLTRYNNIYKAKGACKNAYMLCPRSIFKPFLPDTSCLNQAIQNIQEEVKVIIRLKTDSLRAAFKSAYKAHCFGQANRCWLNKKYKEYHFTLYYYDQVGNLIKTVPPEGVYPINASDTLQWVKDYRNKKAGSLPRYPNHNKATKYIYNTLNQVVKTITPDDSLTFFWYDWPGRVVLSMKAWQFASTPVRLNYTRYDALSRVIESGELTLTAAPSESFVYGDASFLALYNSASSRKYVTRTFYDNVKYQTISPTFGSAGQENLRNRISSVAYFLNYTGNDNTYTNATHYSYDIGGNVKTIVQDQPPLNTETPQLTKVLRYEYDLVSGKVNKVIYQPGQLDMYVQAYYYDEDNKLVRVETSTDSVIWETDVRYAYYPHGPLARKEIGDVRVQGVDYAYTLQGWLKVINAGALDSARDIGLDGRSGLVGKRFNAIDAYGVTLGYYQGDYTKIRFSATSSELGVSGSGFGGDANNLYNGNIRLSTYAIRGLSGDSTKGYAYRYDQLNRLKRAHAWENYNKATWAWNAGGASVNAYRNSYRYSPDGNITFLKRHDNGGVIMDSMSYSYYANPNTLVYPAQNCNRLNFITDPGTFNSGAKDIQSQATLNYKYDRSGQLIGDVSEGITSITWTPQGKVERITKSTGDTITYIYDALQNRIMKRYWSNVSVTKSTDHYIRDAQGNLLALYTSTKKIIAPITSNTVLKELYIYGSDRLGVYNRNIRVVLDGIVDTVPKLSILQMGRKSYELTDHLGNVIATVSDRKLGVGTTVGQPVSYWRPDIITASDYYPFGMSMYGRNKFIGQYRYGYNGKENDNDIKGNGNQQDYGMRFYDPRIGKFLSVDPIARSYPWNSTYAFAENDVIRSIDLDGLEKFIITYKIDNSKITKTKIELETAGSLGDGYAVIVIQGKSKKYFYGDILPSSDNPGKDFSRAYEGTHKNSKGEHTYYTKDGGGNPTIGYGHLIKSTDDYDKNSKLSEDEAVDLFNVDYDSHKLEFSKKLEGQELSQNQEDALTDFGFNTTNKTRNKLFKSKERSGDSFMKYRGGGPGILKRRIGEATLYDESSYVKFEKTTKKGKVVIEKLLKENESKSGNQ